MLAHRRHLFSTPSVAHVRLLGNTARRGKSNAAALSEGGNRLARFKAALAKSQPDEQGEEGNRHEDLAAGLERDDDEVQSERAGDERQFLTAPPACASSPDP